MDIVTASFLNQFKEQYGYTDIAEDKCFELFSTYCIVSSFIKAETISTSLLEDLCIGNGGDWGIDSIILIVNGKIVTTEEEVNDLLDANGYIQLQIVLVQSKTSNNFDIGEFGVFLNGVEFLFKDIIEDINCLPTCNDDLEKYRNLIKYVYTKSAYFKDGINPLLDLYYVTCGEYNNQADFVARIQKTDNTIHSLDLTSSFKCHIFGKKEVISCYKETKSKIEADIKVDNKLIFPNIVDVEEGFLCLIPFKEFKKLIIDNNQNIIQSVFYDNVRSFQGNNSVNKAMSESLKNEDINLFVAMNNGITVIAKDVKTTGLNIHLSDYQIVNGCQTCNVLQQHLDVPNIDDLMLSVKIISSKSKTIKDKIIVGNNSQTEVKREQLVSLLDSQKYIEDYYNAQKTFEKLYYERRSKQYRYEETRIPVNKVITIPFQIKAFVSMILEKPHEVSGYYGSIVEQFDKNGVRVFASETNPALYYTSALANYKMVEWFSKNAQYKDFKKVKFHVLLAFKLMCQKNRQPQLNSNKVQQYCDHLCRILCDVQKCEKGFDAAIKLVSTVLGRSPKDSDRMSGKLTEDMIKTSIQIDSINKNKTLC